MEQLYTIYELRVNSSSILHTSISEIYSIPIALPTTKFHLNILNLISVSENISGSKK